MSLEPSTIADLVTRAGLCSDMNTEELTDLAIVFEAAHRQAPGGLSLEIGTRRGGSAILMLGMLEAIYHQERPMLFSVDPYGYKPYLGGDFTLENLYGTSPYVQAKTNLAGAAHHALWYLTSSEFLARLQGAAYWYQGKQRYLDNYSFVFLDGDHDHLTIATDLALLRGHVRGSILVADVQKDPETLPLLAKLPHRQIGNAILIQGVDFR